MLRYSTLGVWIVLCERVESCDVEWGVLLCSRFVIISLRDPPVQLDFERGDSGGYDLHARLAVDDHLRRRPIRGHAKDHPGRARNNGSVRCDDTFHTTTAGDALARRVDVDECEAVLPDVAAAAAGLDLVAELPSGDVPARACLNDRAPGVQT